MSVLSSNARILIVEPNAEIRTLLPVVRENSFRNFAGMVIWPLLVSVEIVGILLNLYHVAEIKSNCGIVKARIVEMDRKPD